MRENEQFKKMILTCPAEKVKAAYAELIANAISTLAPLEQQYYTQTAKAVTPNPFSYFLLNNSLSDSLSRLQRSSLTHPLPHMLFGSLNIFSNL